MRLPDDWDDGGAHRASGRRFVRGLLVVVLAVMIGLVLLVHPLPEPPASPPPGDPVEPAGSDALEGGTAATAVASPTLAPTDTPLPTPEPTARPTTAPSPTPTVPPTELPPATPTATPEPAPSPTATRAPLAGRVEQGTYQSALTGRAERYRVYVPPGYDETDRRYPVLYLLHGWPYDESHWDHLGVDEAADAGMVNGTLSPFIIILPGADAGGLYVRTSGGPGSFEEQLVSELLPHVDATFRTLQTREARAIGGISRGGVWALEIAFTHPDAFGILGTHSPALAANQAPPAYDPFILLHEPGVESLRIYLSAGDQDWAREATQELHQALNERGIPSQLAVHPGAHADELWAAHVSEYLSFYAAGW